MAGAPIYQRIGYRKIATIRFYGLIPWLITQALPKSGRYPAKIDHNDPANFAPAQRGRNYHTGISVRAERSGNHSNDDIGRWLTTTH
jgi:hypothetical protein